MAQQQGHLSVWQVLLSPSRASDGELQKDRAKDSAEGDRYKVDSKQLFYYWEECNRANQEENDILRQILEKMPNKG